MKIPKILKIGNSYKPKWSKIGFYGEKIFCKKCGKKGNEDLFYGMTSTGRRFRCKKCKIEISFDETTPDRFKIFKDSFVLNEQKNSTIKKQKARI